MSQMNERWSQLETILCINASMRVPCRQSLAIHNSFMAKSDLFIIDNYRQFFRQIYRTYYAMNDKLNTSFLQVFKKEKLCISFETFNFQTIVKF